LSKYGKTIPLGEWRIILLRKMVIKQQSQPKRNFTSTRHFFFSNVAKFILDAF
jgi:hypothetical protein